MGVNNEELANWYAGVKAEFDGLTPQMLRDLNVPVAGTTVVALLFDTDRAPYLVKNPAYGQSNGGPVQLEVPWREARSTRTASRSDLLRILSPIQKNPSFELLHARLTVYPQSELAPSGGQSLRDDSKNLIWKLYMEFYVAPATDARVVIPFHHCRTSFKVSECGSESKFESVFIKPVSSVQLGYSGLTKRTDSLTIECTRYEVLINGPGKIMLSSEVNLPRSETDSKEAGIQVSLLPVDSAHTISFRETLRRIPPPMSSNTSLAVGVLSEFRKAFGLYDLTDKEVKYNWLQ